MSKMKRCLVVSLLAVLAFCLTACQESDESKYSWANKLLNERKYDEAVKIFDEISAYEDASKMAMYGRAIDAAENGDYKSALQSFKALGDYKDCPMMITYYTARQYEDQATDVNWSPRIMAAEAYDTVALFLDSKDRAENNRKTVYDGAVHLADLKQYSESMEILSALRDYKDSALLRRYYEAFNLELEDKFTEASRAFAALEDYKDSKDQAIEVLKRGYQEADGQERLGKQEEAYQIFMNLAECEYEDSFERANKPYYDLGMSLRAEKKWPDAIRAFEHAGTYSDAETQVKETKYMQASDKREQQNWNAAIEIFTALGDYKDSTTVQINETNYQHADALEKEGKQEEAYELFMSLGRYGDSFARANKPYYDLGVAKREAGEWDAAVAAFEHAGTYEDAAEQINATRYDEGEAKRAAQDWNGAVTVFESLGDYSDAATQILETRYQEASALEADGKQEDAHDLFLSLGDYNDSFERAKKPYYELGLAKREAGEWDAAVETFKMAGDYSDAKVQILETRYQEASALEADGKQEAAHDLFLSLGDYADSFERAKKPYYDLGVAKRDAGEWDEAVVAFEKAGTYEDAKNQINATRYAEGEAKRTAHDWDGAITAFEQAGKYKDAADQIKETIYVKARYLYEQNDFIASRAEYCSIQDYKDVDSILKTDIHMHEVLTLPYREIGNIVTLGHYEQDNDRANGSEKIEWIVLDYDEKEHKALLLSKYGLDSKQYNTEWKDMTWEKCTMRNWLNGEFLQSAFSDQEQAAILMTEVDNSTSQMYSEWNTDGGNNTQDRIFLLSYAEANRYLDVTYGGSNNIKARVAPTAFAIAKGAWKSDSEKTAFGDGAGWWWLRSPGSIQDAAAIVRWDGSFLDSNVHSVKGGVRPAFWLDLDSDIF